MVRVIGDQLPVFRRKSLDRPGGRWGTAVRQQKPEARFATPFPEELSSNLVTENLGEKRRDGIANHSLLLHAAALEPDAVREGLDAAHFSGREASVVPMKGACGRARLGVNCPRRPILGQLEKKSPVPGAPAE
jgi:hypothetical protein